MITSRKWKWAITICLASVCGATLGAVTGRVSCSGSSEAAANISWYVPPLANEGEKIQAHETLLRLEPWGKSAEISSDNESVHWQLCGVASILDQKFALIRSDGQVRCYTEGSTLPNGEIIYRIIDNGVEIRSGEIIETRLLYKSSM